MPKDFDRWNEQKKRIHNSYENRHYHEREVWWCALGVNVGFEQDGTGNIGERPALVIKGFSKHVCLVIPLTTSRKKNPYYISLGKLDGKESFAIISQIRLLDTKRFINRIGFADQIIFGKIKKAVKSFF